MNQFVKDYVFAGAGNVLALAMARQQWHNAGSADLMFPGGTTRSLLRFSRERGFSRMAPAEKLDYLLHVFHIPDCTNDLDYLYGLPGMLDHCELPKPLLPDYNLSFGRDSQDYARDIVGHREAT
jgi:hypothetical protein